MKPSRAGLLAFLWQCSLLLLLVMHSGALYAQGPAWQTAMRLGIPASTYPVYGYSWPEAVAYDGAGNMLVAGEFRGSVQFGSTTLVGGTGESVFVAKWSPITGTYLWAQQAGSGFRDKVTAVAVSGTNVYITGSFDGATATFGTISLTNVDVYNSDVFLAKLQDTGSAGTFVWAKRAGGGYQDQATAMAVNGNNVYIAGSFQYDTVRFDNVTLTNAAKYSTDAYVVKLTDAGSTGTFVWGKTAEGSDTDDRATAIAVSGNSIYVAGGFVGARPASSATGGTIRFGNTTLTDTQLYGEDVFVAKLTDNGSSSDFVWAHGIGSWGTPAGTGLPPGTPDYVGYDHATAITANGANVYLAGVFKARNITFGSTTVVNAQEYFDDIFVTKLVDAGNTSSFVWAQRAGGANNDIITALASSGSSVFAVGSFQSPTATFGSGFMLRNATTYSYTDLFVAKLADAGSSGAFTWATRAGDVHQDFATGVAINGSTVSVVGGVGGPVSVGRYPIVTIGDAGLLASVVDGSPLVSSPLAVKTAHLAALMLAPNPAHGTATVQLPAVPGATTATLTVLDALGRPVHTQTAATNSTAALDLTGLAPGLYAVRVAAGGSTATQRLVVE
jgi:hypothetical protein